MASILPPARTQFLDRNGNPLSGCSVYFYVAGTSDLKNTYQDEAQTILNTNPVILDARGEAAIWGTGVYRMVVNDPFGAVIYDAITDAPFTSTDVSDAINEAFAELASTSDITKGDALIGVKQPYTGAVGRTQHSKNTDFIHIRDFGAVGDGVTDDSTAFNAAVTAAAANGFTLRLDNAKVYCATPTTMAGKLTIDGGGTGRLIGAFTYSDTFPVSADSVTYPITAPFLSLNGITFDNESTTTYALTVKAQGGSSFLDCMEMSNCKFFGYNGFQAVNLISVSLINNWFHSLYVGVSSLGGVNWNIVDCWWRNCRQYGFNININPDYKERKGGENYRFANCEFAVCATGIYAFRNVWLSIVGCLFDYCTLPVNLYGSYYAKITNSYLGAADQGSLSGGTGYIAPPTKGCALYMRGAPADANYTSASYCGVSAFNNEFVNYLSGTSLPIVYGEGYLSETVYLLGRHTVFSGNKFIMQLANTATTLLSLSYFAETAVFGNDFISPDLGTTLVAPYVSSNATVHNGGMNNSVECTQGGVPVPLVYDYQTTAGIRGMSTIGTWMQDVGGVNRLGVSTDNLPALLNANVTTSAAGGTASGLPANPLGYVTWRINGGLVKIPYYNA